MPRDQIGIHTNLAIGIPADRNFARLEFVAGAQRATDRNQDLRNGNQRALWNQASIPSAAATRVLLPDRVAHCKGAQRPYARFRDSKRNTRT